MRQARSTGQNVFIWDRDGRVPVFFETFGLTKDFTDEMVQVALSNKGNVNKTLSRSLGLLMDSLLSAMDTGTHLLLNLGMLAPDFKEVYTDDDLFPAQKVFNASKWRLEGTHLPYARQRGADEAPKASLKITKGDVDTSNNKHDNLTSPIRR